MFPYATERLAGRGAHTLARRRILGWAAQLLIQSVARPSERSPRRPPARVSLLLGATATVAELPPCRAFAPGANASAPRGDGTGAGGSSDGYERAASAVRGRPGCTMDVSADLLGRSDDDPLRATHEAEPVAVLVLRDLADEVGAAQRATTSSMSSTANMIGVCPARSPARSPARP